MTARFRQQSVIGHPGVAVQFIDLSTESPTAWEWTFYDTDGITVLGTSTEQNPIFTYPVAGAYPVSLCVVETGVPTQPPPVDPGDPPDPTFPPTDPPVPPSDDPPAALLAGRALTINHEFANGIPTIWTVLAGASGREGTIQTWDTALTTFDSEGLHLAIEEDAPGGPFRSGAVEAQLGTRHGLYAFKVTGVPIGHALRTSIILYSQTGDQEIGIFEFPNVDPTHYYTRTTFPNTPTRPVLFDPTADHIYAVDWTPTRMQFYLDWYALGNPITDPALLAAFAAGTYAVSVHTLVGGPWAGTPDGSTDVVFSDGEELVLEWFRHWATIVPTPPPDPPPSNGATDAAYRNSVLAEVQGFAQGAVTGGRNAPLFTVTSNADSGTGTLRDALSQSNRYITFSPETFPYAVPVPINLLSPINARGINNITIDAYGALPYFPAGSYGITTGEFAPTGATGISNNWIIVNLKHVGTPPGDGNDCLTLDGTDRGVLLHCDMQRGGDGSVDITMTGSGPNPYGLWTWAYCKIGDAQGGKGCLIEDQTGPDPAYDQPGAGSNYPGSYAYFSPSSIWPSGAALNRDCYITIDHCEFFGTLRNPVVANFGAHFINSYHHDYDLEGLSIFGFNAKVRATCPVVDGAGASFPERGILSWDFDNPGTGHPPDRMRKWVLIERPAYLNGATFTDGSSYTNPDSNQLVIPYNYAVTEVEGDAGAALLAEMTDTDLTNVRRAGQIVRKGYHQLVGVSPPPVVGPGRNWQVPAEGSFQAVVDQAQPGDNIYVTGTVSTGGKVLEIANRDNGNFPITVIGNPGSVLQGGESGIEGYGSCRGWHFDSLTVEVDGSAYYGEGFYIGGQRTDHGGDGQGAADIRITNCTVRPISGTGTIQRNGIAVWGADVVEIGNCTINDAAYNDLGFPGGAGSGISCGETIGSSRASLSNGARFWIHDNVIDGMVGPGTGAYDRNGIILDLFLGAPGNPLNANRMHGLTIIEDNTISNCEGRGIQLLMAGQSDSEVRVLRNVGSGFLATNLDGSEPIAGIGGYGDGRCGNIVCTDNDLTAMTAGPDAYKFISFDAAMDPAIDGVRGTGNLGTPKTFVNSPTNVVPPGF